MTDLRHRLNAFVKLGSFFKGYCKYAKNKTQIEDNQHAWFVKLDEILVLAGHHNGWFTPENILYSLESWAELLTLSELESWLSDYDLTKNKPKTVALIMAGNIPLVGFHDFLSALITGNRVMVKLSSNDKILLPFIAQYLIGMEPLLKDQISFVEGKLEDFDVVIATGSDNTSRYFEHYFGSKPNIIRRNRNSVAILNGKETNDELAALGEDIFRYYGLGCRSVSKLFVPRNYNFDALFKALYPFNTIIEQHKYANNYDYNKAVYLMSLFKILENGFLMLKEDESYASPIATVFYEFYDSLEELKIRLSNEKEKIQCIVANGFMVDEVPFGHTQKPSLADYADNIDTVDFLLKT
ncbi:acyl-CoA reductase [Arenibacter sp. F20364]|uniref:acyl-CoA reductase n=1 Tax=Arenibacter sp. F20364 TaxID=2926415 RepID=UPI001FF610D1|nr:acyl-CoA reductase [Arenibacter sp. F20364]MCK0191165.1 acyl-CoA reductase [Arenibacter sp. F20364]